MQTGTKSIILLLYKDDFLNGIKFLQKFWRSDKFGTVVNKQMDNYRLFVGTVLRIFRLVIAVSGTLYLTKPFFEKHRILPVTCLLMCDIEYNLCYISYYILQTAALTTQLLTIVGFDGLFFTLLISGYAELEQIKYAFTNVNIQEDEEETLREMASIIEHHNLVLE